MEVTHSQRRLAAARVHLEREESIKNLTAAHEAAQKRGTPGAELSSSAKPPALSPTEESKSEPREATAITPTTATGVSFGKRKLREDCVLANLRPVAVLGEGAFGLVQLVEHRVGTCYAMSCLACVCIWLTTRVVWCRGPGDQGGVCSQANAEGSHREDRPAA